MLFHKCDPFCFMFLPESRFPRSRSILKCTADAIRKPLEWNGLMRGGTLRGRQNDEGSASAQSAIAASGT
jgi:hypothetical protein